MIQANPDRIDLRTALLRLTAPSFGAAILLAMLAASLSAFLGPVGGGSAVLLAIAVGLAGSLVGSAVPAAMINAPPQQRAAGLLGGLALRFFVTLGLGLALWHLVAGRASAFLIWVAVLQLVFLTIDVAAVIRIIRSTGGSSGC
ncbi:MAG: hypothetical protein HZB38_16335 [Planctomycetes bacterium]|nr:hypothetical protein [Planctomycetota bacterium]